MASKGERNLITDIDGLTVGNAVDEKVKTGVTVLRCREAFVAAVDIRGGGPGARETDALAPENLVGKADAIVLSGGSVFGLAAADSVTTMLSQKHIGLRLVETSPAIPIVPAAVLHDLGNQGDKQWGDAPPYAQLGKNALAAAARDFQLGRQGAGRGAMAGAKPGGLGSSSLILDDGVAIGALAAVNPAGSVVMPDGETFYAAPWEIDGEFGGGKTAAAKDDPHPFPRYSRLGMTRPRENTVIAIVAASADLTRAEAKRVAVMAHDGIARAVRPAHTPFDGDIVFAVATGENAMPATQDSARALRLAEIGAAAGDCLARAIARGVYEAMKKG